MKKLFTSLMFFVAILGSVVAFIGVISVALVTYEVRDGGEVTSAQGVEAVQSMIQWIIPAVVAMVAGAVLWALTRELPLSTRRRLSPSPSR